ncbi:MAG: ORF6N domain-containing protein [Patescibacteria group bacterium]
MKNSNKEIIAVPCERIINKIFLIRGKKVMIDKELAELYNVETKILIQAVKRNIKRFPEDFMFQLTKTEFINLRSQIVTSSWGGRRYSPYAFTEQGVAMLSSVLNSKKAIMVNIQIIRTFTQLRELLSTNKDLKEKIENMEKKYDKQLREIFEVIKYLLVEETKSKEPIGFSV